MSTAIAPMTTVTTPTTAPVTLRRANTPGRWQAALRRALVEGVQVRQLAGSGAWVATSSSDPATAYEVTPWTCECQAGQHEDPVCKHRAALHLRLGRLRPTDEVLVAVGRRAAA